MTETTKGTPERLSLTETAKAMRVELKAAFPGVKFGVRSQRYAGGCSIHVDWTDGPTRADVHRVTDKYGRCGFDGMTDSKTYRGPTLNDGQTESGADYILCHRHHIYDPNERGTL